jgi:hypothetical protein
MGESINGEYDVGTEKPRTIVRVWTQIEHLKNLEVFVKILFRKPPDGTT